MSITAPCNTSRNTYRKAIHPTNRENGGRVEVRRKSRLQAYGNFDKSVDWDARSAILFLQDRLSSFLLSLFNSLGQLSNPFAAKHRRYDELLLFAIPKMVKVCPTFPLGYREAFRVG